MHMLKSADEGRTNIAWVEDSAKKFNITINDIRSWISGYESSGRTIPTIYYEEYYEQIDVDRWSDSKDVFTSSGEHAREEDHREGDILELAEMPFDKNGCHASGYSIWGRAAAGNYCWIDEYEE